MARSAHILQIQTIPLDDTRTIGVIDLRTCLLAVAQSSPEIMNQQENDFSVYAYDYSEPEVPLVGQGLLSWAMDSRREPQQQLVTGRVTRNVLALLTNGSRDTLEVKLKFATVARMPQRAEYPSMEPVSNGARAMSIPADTASEWNSFVQSNPMLGQPSNVPSVSSPALAPVHAPVLAPAPAPAQPSQYNGPQVIENNQNGRPRSSSRPPQLIRPASIPPANVPQPIALAPASRASSAVPIPPRPQTSTENEPSPSAPAPTEPARKPRSSRPSSRSRSKQPTGRPRGRPRKRPLEAGNTSAAEEGTDGDEAPQKRRAKVTKTEYSAIAPFGAAPESLRVAASTSGSLRAMRPVGSGVEGPAAQHLLDVPRAPTPIPGGPMVQQQMRRMLDSQSRTDSNISMDQSGLGRSPADSTAQSPDHGYLPEDSAGDLNSSPPVPRATAYIQSSPPPSSPILPSMAMPQVDSGFMSGGLDDIFDEAMLQRLSETQGQDQMLPISSLPVASKSKKSRSQSQRQQSPNYPFQEVNPGPPELLPTSSIFKPAGKAKPLNRQPDAPLAQHAPPKKAPSRSLKRANTAPNPLMSEQESLPQEEQNPAHHPNDDEALQALMQPDMFPDQVPFSNGMECSTQATGNDADDAYMGLFPQEPASTTGTPMPSAEPQEPEPALPAPAQPQSKSRAKSRSASRPASRPASQGYPAPSDPAPTMPAPDFLPEQPLTFPAMVASEPPCPMSDFDPPRYSKNLVKKQSIKEKLENAIQKGESPPFCSNCGAIETPTWRKIWTQDHEGVPEFHEFSDKPGCVTMIDVLERDEDEQPSKYRMVKKNLGPRDDKKTWTETLLCNPCGIWLGKFKAHRPPDRWDKDAARLNQPRKKREPKSRSKKAAKNDTQAQLTSEAYFPTDPIGPVDIDFDATQTTQPDMALTESTHLNLRSSPRLRFLGSTHSRGSGTADSPIAVEDELGSTRRLLFPSPRRDGTPKVLGELPLNQAQSGSHAHEAKSAARGKENTDIYPERPGTPILDDRLSQELFGTPPRCPSTPPPKAAPAGPFKTPTRPTPSHRPITRSISRSIRSSKPKSPGQLFGLHHLQRTPSRTPRSASGGHGPSSGAHHLLLPPSSASRRRSPRSAGIGAHLAFPMDMSDMPPLQFDSPFTATLHQLLSEANDFIGGGSPSQHRGEDMGMHHQHGEGAGVGMDFGNFLGTDLVMPSSPPLMARGRNGSREEGFGEVLGEQQQEAVWAEQLAAAGGEEGR